MGTCVSSPRRAVGLTHPAHRRIAGYGQRKILRKGDYYNLAQLAGKTHMEYVTPFNATILRDADGGLVDWNHVNFVGEVAVDVQVGNSSVTVRDMALSYGLGKADSLKHPHDAVAVCCTAAFPPGSDVVLCAASSCAC